MLLQVAGDPADTRFTDQCAAVERNGFDGVEWVVPPAAMRRAGAAEIRSPVRAVAGSCSTCDVQAAIAEVGELLWCAASWKATCVNLTIPPVHRAEADRGFARYQDALNFAYEMLHQLRFDAEATGVALALEAATGSCLLSPVELREIIDAANSSAVGACLDATRIELVGSLHDWVTTLSPRVFTLRIAAEEQVTDDDAQAASESLRRSAVCAWLDEVGSSASLVLASRIAGGGHGRGSLRRRPEQSSEGQSSSTTS